MKTNQNKPQIRKFKRIIAAVLSVMMLSTSGLTGVMAAAKPTIKHYPGVASVIANSDGTTGTVYWQAPINTAAETKLYKWDANVWTEVADASASGTAITDVNALYKIVNTFEDGVTTEYVIQKNKAGLTYTSLDGYTTHWAGSAAARYVGVTGADAYEGERSLKIRRWSPSGNWALMTIFTKDTSWYNSEKAYQLSYYLKTEYYAGAPMYFMSNKDLAWNNMGPIKDWMYKTHKLEAGGATNVEDWQVLSVNESWGGDLWIDDIQIHELDAEGNVVGENLLPGGNFEFKHDYKTRLGRKYVGNLAYTGIDNGAILSWTNPGEDTNPEQTTIGTRVYNEDGFLIAELGDATSLPVTGLTNGEEYTYTLRCVYKGGYESTGTQITVVAGENKNVTDKHYPSVARVTAADDGVSGTLYWEAPQAGDISATKLYKFSDGMWNVVTDVTGATTAEIDDITALYKIENIFSDGIKTEYVIQKNDSGTAATVLMPIGSWGGSSKNKYVGVTGSDAHSGERSLRTHTWDASGAHRMRVQLINNPAVFEEGQLYRISLWHKSSSNSGTSLVVDGSEIKGLNDTTDNVPEWKEYTTVFTGSGNTEGWKTFSLDLCYRDDAWIDDIEIYKINENGEKLSSNLMVGGDFEAPNADGTLPAIDATDVTYTGIENGTVLKWTKGSNSIGTRVYSSNGNLIAELGNAVSLPIAGLTEGEEYTYTLKSVYVGGYESAGVDVTLVAGEDAPKNVTVKHYPGVASVIENSEGTAATIYWQEPANTATETKLYKREANKWTEIPNANPAGTEVTDIDAVYKIVNTFEDGVTTEYVIQKNKAGLTYTSLDGHTDYWAGSATAKYVGVTGADAYEGERSLKIRRWSAAENYALMTIFTKDTSWYNSEKTYQLSYYLKTECRYGAPTRFLGSDEFTWDTAGGIQNWTYKTHKIEAGAGSTATDWKILSVNESHAGDLWIDNIQIHELDADGNIVGENLLPGGDFELPYGSANEPVTDVSDISYTGIENGAVLNWTKTDSSIGTRVYNSNGKLIAELGDATSLLLTGLENGKNYEYTLRSVYTGGYESADTTVTVTAGGLAFDIVSEGFDIYEDGEITDSMYGGEYEYTASANLKNNTATEKNVMIAIAVYSSTGELLEVELETKTITGGGSDIISVNYASPEDDYEEGTYAKAFLWDMTDGRNIPISNAIDVECA